MRGGSAYDGARPHWFSGFWPSHCSQQGLCLYQPPQIKNRRLLSVILESHALHIPCVRGMGRKGKKNTGSCSLLSLSAYTNNFCLLKRREFHKSW